MHSTRSRTRLAVQVVIAGVIVALLAPAGSAAAEPAAVGYRDFSYEMSGVSAPTGEKPQSKAWFADGAWWAALLNRTTGSHHFYRLNTADQAWSDTGVVVDSRKVARLDVLWDGGKLYVASAGRTQTNANHRVQVTRYSYDAANRTYTRDSGFPVTVVNGGVEAVVLDKDTLGKVWVTYTRDNRVYVAHSTTSETAWTAPFVVPVTGADTIAADDISAVVAYDDRIGVMWSNQTDSTMYFASHADGEPDGQWELNPAVQSPGYADDHISLKSLTADDAGRVYAVTKTELTGSGSPLVLVMRLSPQGSWSRATYGRVADDHTRPILVVNREARKVYVFAAAPCCSGGTIYYKESSIDNLSFEPGIGTPFIRGIDDRNVNNPTSTKQEVSNETGILVIASDDKTKYYLHNYVPLGGATPTDTTPPDTTIDSGPSGVVAETSATFTFSASESGSTFECRLDGGTFTSCTSPATHFSLAPGEHEIEVRATDSAGNVDPTPATRSWTVEQPATTTTTVIEPSDDARVQQDSPDRSYRRSYLFTDSAVGANIESNLRFSVTGTSGTVASAVMRIYAISATDDGPAVYTTAGPWTESNLTWNTRPDRATGPLADAGAIPARTWVEFDLTGTVTGNGTYDLALITSSTDGVKFASRDDAEAPELVITTTSP
ncbi:hypothetical protein BH23ACT10_BH23ACT10_17610 [soil metagenome]